MGIAAGSYADSNVALNQDTDLNRANQQVHSLAEQLQQEYGVYTVCTSAGGSWGSFACGQEVRGNYSQPERNRIKSDFNEKLRIGKKEIFASIDEEVIKEAAIRGLIRLAGIFSGLSLAVIGIAGIKAKEEK